MITSTFRNPNNHNGSFNRDSHIETSPADRFVRQSREHSSFHDWSKLNNAHSTTNQSTSKRKPTSNSIDSINKVGKPPNGKVSTLEKPSKQPQSSSVLHSAEEKFLKRFDKPGTWGRSFPTRFRNGFISGLTGSSFASKHSSIIGPDPLFLPLSTAKLSTNHKFSSGSRDGLNTCEADADSSNAGCGVLQSKKSALGTKISQSILDLTSSQRLRNWKTRLHNPTARARTPTDPARTFPIKTDEPLPDGDIRSRDLKFQPITGRSGEVDSSPFNTSDRTTPNDEFPENNFNSSTKFWISPLHQTILTSVNDSSSVSKNGLVSNSSGGSVVFASPCFVSASVSNDNQHSGSSGVNTVSDPVCSNPCDIRFSACTTTKLSTFGDSNMSKYHPPTTEALEENHYDVAVFRPKSDKNNNHSKYSDAHRPTNTSSSWRSKVWPSPKLRHNFIKPLTQLNQKSASSVQNPISANSIPSSAHDHKVQQKGGIPAFGLGNYAKGDIVSQTNQSARNHNDNVEIISGGGGTGFKGGFYHPPPNFTSSVIASRSPAQRRAAKNQRAMLSRSTGEGLDNTNTYAELDQIAEFARKHLRKNNNNNNLFSHQPTLYNNGHNGNSTEKIYDTVYSIDSEGTKASEIANEERGPTPTPPARFISHGGVPVAQNPNLIRPVAFRPVVPAKSSPAVNSVSGGYRSEDEARTIRRNHHSPFHLGSGSGGYQSATPSDLRTLELALRDLTQSASSSYLQHPGSGSANTSTSGYYSGHTTVDSASRKGGGTREGLMGTTPPVNCVSDNEAEILAKRVDRMSYGSGNGRISPFGTEGRKTSEIGTLSSSAMIGSNDRDILDSESTNETNSNHNLSFTSHQAGAPLKQEGVASSQHFSIANAQPQFYQPQCGRTIQQVRYVGSRSASQFPHTDGSSKDIVNTASKSQNSESNYRPSSSDDPLPSGKSHQQYYSSKHAPNGSNLTSDNFFDGQSYLRRAHKNSRRPASSSDRSGQSSSSTSDYDIPVPAIGNHPQSSVSSGGHVSGSHPLSTPPYNGFCAPYGAILSPSSRASSGGESSSNHYHISDSSTLSFPPGRNHQQQSGHHISGNGGSSHSTSRYGRYSQESPLSQLRPPSDVLSPPLSLHDNNLHPMQHSSSHQHQQIRTPTFISGINPLLTSPMSGLEMPDDDINCAILSSPLQGGKCHMPKYFDNTSNRTPLYGYQQHSPHHLPFPPNRPRSQPSAESPRKSSSANNITNPLYSIPHNIGSSIISTPPAGSTTYHYVSDPPPYPGSRQNRQLPSNSGGRDDNRSTPSSSNCSHPSTGSAVLIGGGTGGPRGSFSPQDSRHSSSGIQVTPSPSDSGVMDLESVLREKEQELSNLRHTMEQNEHVIVRVCQEKESQWQDKLADWSTRLNQSVQTEQRLQTQVESLQDERACMQAKLDALAMEKAGLQRKVRELESEYFRLKELMRAQEKHPPAATLCSRCSSGGLLASSSQRQAQSAPGSEAKALQVQQQQQSSIALEFNRFEQENGTIGRGTGRRTSGGPDAEPASYDDDLELRSQVGQLRGEVNELKLVLKEQLDVYEREKIRWQEEQCKAHQYQKLLQSNYMSVYKKNRQLELKLKDNKKGVDADCNEVRSNEV